MKFYTSDWRSDPCLRMCGIASRGLWIEMICIMHEATPYGHLLVAGHCPTDAQLAVLVGTTPDQVAAMLGELESAGVFSRTREGVIYSRKMTRAAKKAATARNNGRKGGNPTLCNLSENSALDKGGVKGEVKTQKPEARSQIEGGGGARARDHAPAHARGDDPPPESLVSMPDDAVALYENVMAACGVRNDIITTYWMPPTAIIEVARWRGLGLTDEEIIEVAKGSRRAKREPPNGPKALERFMAIAASVKADRRSKSLGEGHHDRHSDSGSEALRRSLERAAKPDKGLDFW